MNSNETHWTYPLAQHHAETLQSPTGLPFTEVTLDALLEGKVKLEDLRVTAEALEHQAQFALQAGRPQLAGNLRRAAELVQLPEETLLEIYTALRPGRTTRAGLLAWAEKLESDYHAPRCARFVREAAAACFPSE